MTHRPRIVLLVGEPGSGKTTLGTDLARALRLPFLARDDVRTGLWASDGAWSEQPGPAPSGDDAAEKFLGLVASMAATGVSCVVEYVLRSSRPEDLRRLRTAGDVLVVRVHADDALERRADGDRADRLGNRRPVLDSLGFADGAERVESNRRRMADVVGEMATCFDDLPVLAVDGTDGWDPPFDQVVDEVAAWLGSPASAPLA